MSHGSTSHVLSHLKSMYCLATTYSYVWQWLIHMCDMTHSYVWHDPFICVTWLIHMCDMTHSHVWHDPFIWVTWLIHMCDMTHSYAWHDPFICVTWPIHMSDMNQLNSPYGFLRSYNDNLLWHESIERFVRSDDDNSLLQVIMTTHYDMGWLWLVGSIKL